jgi:phosphopentomutase
LAKVKGIDSGVGLGIRETFGDVGETVLDFYGMGGSHPCGTSFLGEVRGA